MATDEVKRQKADILLEYQETEMKLEHLRVKARGMGESLSTMGRWLITCPEKHFYSTDQASYGADVEVTGKDYVEALEPKQYFELANDIRETSQKLVNLARTKERLGLK